MACAGRDRRSGRRGAGRDDADGNGGYAHGRPCVGQRTPVVLTIVAANALNVALNWVFIFGHLGAPALGVAGSAISTLVSRWTMFVMLLVLSWRELRPHLAAIDPASFARAPLWRML